MARKIKNEKVNKAQLKKMNKAKPDHIIRRLKEVFEVE